MHISRVELENFKSHENSVYEFERGTTAISGDNGAGKTSIIEAIAWTIFDTLEYRKDDVIRRGAKKAVARVTFESSQDEREYTVYRDSGTGYYIFDPRLQARIAEKKEDVTRFLWQHLGIEPGTDLRSLFTQAIGVPQGTFTAIFLASTSERKSTFDTLLKVEEYRRSAAELLRTVRHIEQKIGDVNVSIARSEGEISRIAEIEDELKAVSLRANERSAELASLNDATAAKKNEVEAMDLAEEKLRELTAAAEKAVSERSRAEIMAEQSETELLRARAASELIAGLKADCEAHQAALHQVKELERARIDRQKAADALAIIVASVAANRIELDHDKEELRRAESAASEIESLAVAEKRQRELESELSIRRRELASAETLAKQAASLNERMESLRLTYRKALSELNAAKLNAEAAGTLAGLQDREAMIVQEIAAATAALERDERFQAEIKNGLCPILSQRCLNLAQGETLEGFVSSQFGELRERIGTLKSEQETIATQLALARESSRSAAQIPIMETRLAEIETEGKRLRSAKEQAEKDGERLTELRGRIEAIETELRDLDNPIGRVSLLRKETERRAEIVKSIAARETALARLEAENNDAADNLKKYAELDSQLATAVSTRDRTEDGFRRFVANEALAGRERELAASFERLTNEREQKRAAAQNAATELEKAAGGYDRPIHASERALLTALNRRQAETSVLLDNENRRKGELTAELERLRVVREAMKAELTERERLQRVAEATEFIRTTLKEAAPLIAKNYVHHVSVEANQLFREISGNAERTLKWGEDYAIILEEGGYDRPFQSLSGGEQMAAAISVRLALLKQLSDIRIAFFDEPTTNMDAERRENLAMQISNITNFDQLFVISHDDTFEGYMDHEVRVE